MCTWDKHGIKTDCADTGNEKACNCPDSRKADLHVAEPTGQRQRYNGRDVPVYKCRNCKTEV